MIIKKNYHTQPKTLTIQENNNYNIDTHVKLCSGTLLLLLFAHLVANHTHFHACTVHSVFYIAREWYSIVYSHLKTFNSINQSAGLICGHF